MSIAGGVRLLAIFLISISTAVSASTLEKYLSEAHTKAKQGDLETAAVLYQKALKLDGNNLSARKGLATVLMEARLRLNDPDSDHSEAELAVIREVTSDQSSASTSFPVDE